MCHSALILLRSYNPEAALHDAILNNPEAAIDDAIANYPHRLRARAGQTESCRPVLRLIRARSGRKSKNPGSRTPRSGKTTSKRPRSRKPNVGRSLGNDENMSEIPSSLEKRTERTCMANLVQEWTWKPGDKLIANGEINGGIIEWHSIHVVVSGSYAQLPYSPPDSVAQTRIQYSRTVILFEVEIYYSYPVLDQIEYLLTSIVTVLGIP